MRKLLGIVILFLVSFSVPQTFSATMDTLCSGSQGEIDAGIVIFAQSSSTFSFIKCFEGRVLQPIGGDIEYVMTRDEFSTLTIVDNALSLQSISSDHEKLGKSAEYGSMYMYDNLVAMDTGDGLLAGTATYDDSITTKQYISWALVAILLLMILMTLASRKRKESA